MMMLVVLLGFRSTVLFLVPYLFWGATSVFRKQSLNSQTSLGMIFFSERFTEMLFLSLPGDLPSPDLGSFDVILGADITYDCNAATVEALLDLIASYAHDTTQIFLAHGVRNTEKAMALWTMVKRRWQEAQVNDGIPSIEDLEENSETPVMIMSFVGRGE